MKKIVLLYIFFYVGFVFTYAQEKESISLEKQFGIEANLFTPGFGVSYELPISQNILFDFAGGFGMPLMKYTGRVEIGAAFIKPYTRIEGKYYYNRVRRARKGKEINNNRGNFIGLQSKVMFSPDSDNFTIMLNEVHWGVQTEIAKKLLLTFQIGAAHYYTKEKEHYYSPILDFKVKYVLF